jgi:hypothetical protein
MPQYNGVWTIEAAAQAQSNQQWVTDPNFKNTTLLLQADNAANSAQNNTFLDSSSNSFAITRNGNVTQGSFTPFSEAPGSWSALFAGNGAYVQGNTTTLPATTTSTFTIEYWYYPTSFATAAYIVGDMQVASNLNYFSSIITTSGKVQLFWFDGGNPTCTSNTSLTLNAWNYVAIRVSSNAISMYVNSTTPELLTGTTTLTNRGGAVNYAIGQYNSVFLTGHISNVRISTVARTISSVPTAPFVTDADTRILILQNNRFVDNGTAASTLTPAVTYVQAFSPFAPQFQWTAPVIGGSGYFDGTGDSLTTACASNNSAFGTADFTVEVWIYPTASASFVTPISSNYSNATAIGNWAFYFGVGSATTVYFNGGSANSGTNKASSTTTTIPLNAWTQVVYSRVSSVGRFFINGVQLGTTLTDANNYSSVAGTLYFGRMADGSNTLTGYVSDVRIIKGTGYTTYPLPTAPLTAITNTGVLLSFTNAGIYDGTMNNVLETVGNAQVNTTIVKYGSGSMAFDGTGDYLTIPLIRAILPPITTSSNFTIEMWMFCTQYQTSNNPGLLGDMSATSSILYFGVGLTTTGSPYFYWYTGAGLTATAAGSVPLNTWTHVAFQANAGVISIFINGVNQTISGTTTLSAPTGSTGNLVIGQFNGGGAAGGYFGYLDDLRISKTVRYLQNFIPPQVALPRQ